MRRAIGGALISTPYIALIWLFSQWSMPSSARARWMLYAIAGNLALFVTCAIAVVAELRRRRRKGAASIA